MTDLPAAGNIRLRVFFTRTTSQSPRLREALATVAITRRRYGIPVRVRLPILWFTRGGFHAILMQTCGRSLPFAFKNDKGRHKYELYDLYSFTETRLEGIL